MGGTRRAARITFALGILALGSGSVIGIDLAGAATITVTNPGDFAVSDVTTATSDVIVPVGTGTVTGVSVTVALDHTWIGDVRIQLTHVPTGTVVTLLDQPGAPANPNVNLSSAFPITFSDAGGLPAAESMGNGLSGNNAVVCEDDGICAFTPEGALSAFAGLAADGVWRLTVSDLDANKDTGLLAAWFLTVTTDPAPTTTTTTAPTTTTTVAPTTTTIAPTTTTVAPTTTTIAPTTTTVAPTTTTVAPTTTTTAPTTTTTVAPTTTTVAPTTTTTGQVPTRGGGGTTATTSPPATTTTTTLPAGEFGTTSTTAPGCSIRIATFTQFACASPTTSPSDESSVQVLDTDLTAESASESTTTTPSVSQSTTLPRTGTNTRGVVLVATGLILLGVGAMLTRRGVSLR